MKESLDHQFKGRQKSEVGISMSDRTEESYFWRKMSLFKDNEILESGAEQSKVRTFIEKIYEKTRSVMVSPAVRRHALNLLLAIGVLGFSNETFAFEQSGGKNSLKDIQATEKFIDNDKTEQIRLSPEEVEEEEKLRAEQLQYLSLIKTLKDKKIDFNIESSSISFSGMGYSSPMDCTSGLYEEISKLGGHTYGGDPLNKLEETAGELIGIDNRLIVDNKEKNGPIRISRYHLRFGLREDSTSREIIFEDWLSKKPVLLRQFFQGTDGKDYDAWLEKNTKDIIATMKGTKNEVDLESVKPLNAETVLTFADKGFNPEIQKIIQEIKKNDWRMSIDFGRRGEGDVTSFSNRKIDLDTLIRYGSLRIASLNKIIFERSEKIQKSDTAKNFLAEKTFYDSFGNQICVTNQVDSVGRYEQVIYEIAYPLTSNDKLDESFVSLDLQPLGIDGKIDDFALRPMEHRLDIKDIKTNYSIFASPEVTKYINGKNISLYVQGVNIAEKLFGALPGEKVKKLYMIDSPQLNAYFDDRDTVVLSFQKGLLDKETNGKAGIILPDLIAEHETFHLFDRIYHISSSPSWKKLFQSFNPGELGFLGYVKEPSDFYKAINESNFDQKQKLFGGHSSDNSKEFLASFVNSLTRADWEKIMVGRSGNFIQKYKKTLLVLRDILLMKKEIPKTAPILKVLEEKISYLEGF